MMKTTLIAMSTFLIGSVILYTWFNRDSDRVVFTLVTALTIAALGFITKETISNKKETFTKKLPVAVFYGLPNYAPLNIKLPYSSDLRTCLESIDPKDMPKIDEQTRTIDINFAGDIYFDAIQYLIVTTIFKRFNHGWNVEAERICTPNGDQLIWSPTNEKGKEITIAEFFEKFTNNRFVKLKLYKNIHENFGDKAIFPPDTDIKIEPEFGRIIFKTKYISLSIMISRSSSSLDIGEYEGFFDSPSSAPDIKIGLHVVKNGRVRGDIKVGEYGNSVYRVEINAEQKLWLNGHPEMKKHRKWADSITELLETDFNYELIRENHMRKFQLFGIDGIK